MTAPLQITLIRHGETAWSLSGQHTGRTDLPLTPHGEQMARALAPVLSPADFSLVLTSPRLRARSTCTLAGLGQAAEVDPDLAEWDYGDFEGLRTADIQQARPGWDIWRDGCPGGETPEQIAQRADRVIARLLKRELNREGGVAIFSHGQFGRVLAARWIGMPAAHGRHFALDPATISILGFEPQHPQRPVICVWNAAPSGPRREV